MSIIVFISRFSPTQSLKNDFKKIKFSQEIKCKRIITNSSFPIFYFPNFTQEIRQTIFRFDFRTHTTLNFVVM